MISAIPFRAMVAGTALCMATAAHADIVISSAATSSVTCTSGVCTPSSPDAVLNVGDLETLLASGNVKLAAAGEPVDVDIAAALSWVSTNTLTLDSYHGITVQQPVAITGGGDFALITDDGGTGGAFAFLPGANVAFLNGSGTLTINGTAYTLVNDIATLASDIAANPSGSYALAGNYNAGSDGTYTASPVGTDFAGNFHGLGNTISNLAISSSTRSSNLGLFAYAGTGAMISSVVLQNATVAESANSSLVGARVGENAGTLFGDHSSGSITGARDSRVGGLTGANWGAVLNSSSSARATAGSESSVGGLVGENFMGSIDLSFSSGTSEGKRTNAAVGGLVGYDDGGTISDSYATGAANGTGPESQIGGLVGYFQGASISNSYALGDVSGSEFVGGFIGLLATGTTSNDYWDTTTSGTDYATGNAKNEIPGMTGLSSKKLKSHLPEGFDPSIWAESPSINNGFPYLIANPPQ